MAKRGEGGDLDCITAYSQRVCSYQSWMINMSHQGVSDNTVRLLQHCRAYSTMLPTNPFPRMSVDQT